MVKFELHGANGRQVIGMGLSDENIKRLKNNQPITFSLAEFGFEETDVLILWGPTEAEIAEMLRTTVEQMAPGAEIAEGEQYCDCPPGGPMSRRPHRHNPRPMA